MALHEVKYYSNALQKATGAFVIHPDPSVPRPYHCMVLMHGLSDDYTIWQRRTSIERYVDGKPLIVVMPDGGRGFYANAIQGYRYLTALADELPELMNHWYKVDGKWCTAGLSMGGYGALRVALEHPGLFRSAVSHSGALLIGHHYPTSDPNNPSKWDNEFLPIFGSVSPGGPNDLIALAKRAEPAPAIRIDCGTEDFLLGQNRETHKMLTEAGIKHEYQEFPGDHNWVYWDKHIQEAIEFNLKNLNV
jgi:putative tributyrin esterase